MESGAFFDEMIRTRPRQADDQSGPRQRCADQPFDARRGVSTVAAGASHDDAKLADATAEVDVYLVPANIGRAGVEAAAPAAGAAAPQPMERPYRRGHASRETRRRAVAARRGGERSPPQPHATPLHHGEPGRLSRAGSAQSDSRSRDRRPASPSMGVLSAKPESCRRRQGVSGRRRLPFEASDLNRLALWRAGRPRATSSRKRPTSGAGGLAAGSLSAGTSATLKEPAARPPALLRGNTQGVEIVSDAARECPRGTECATVGIQPTSAGCFQSFAA